MLCDVTRCDIPSQQGRELQKLYQRRYIVNLSDTLQCSQENTGQALRTPWASGGSPLPTFLLG